MKRIHLLKPGTFTAEDGKQYTFSAADMKSIARSYNPALSEAPIVVGHPTSNAPAFGWIAKAEVDDAGNLFVVPRQVNPAFAEAAKGGSYKKVSAKLYGPDNPRNPVKGEWYLQHVGFLGGHAPAVKGLEEIQFAADEGPAVCVSLNATPADPDSQVRKFFESITRFFGQSPALSEDTVGAIVAATDTGPAFSEWNADRRQQLADGKIKGDFAGPGQSYPVAGEDDVKNAWDLAGRAGDPDAVRRKVITIAKKHGWHGALPDSAKKFASDNSISLSEPEDMDKLQQLEQENARLKAEAAAGKQAAAKVRQEGIAAFAEGLVKEGRLLPTERPLLIELCSRIEEGTTVALSEGGEKKDLLTSVQEMFKALPKRVELREIAGAKNGNPQPGEVAFTAPPGYTVQADRLELHQRAEAYMREHPNTSYQQAVTLLANA